MSIRLKLKTSDNIIAKTIRNLIKKVLCTGIPINKITKPAFLLLYYVYEFIRNILEVLCKILVIEPLFRARCEKTGKNLRMEKLPYVQGHGKILIGDNVYLSGKSGFLVGGRHYENPAIIIGNNTFIGHDCGFSANLKIKIGDNCYVAGGVKIFDSDGHPISYLERREKKPVHKEDVLPVVIEDDVWIGARTIILKGVTIGARSIIGAGSVVTKSILPDNIVVGNPVRVIKVIKKTNM